MGKILILILIWFNGFMLSAQINVYQDVFKGGVTGDAFNNWFSPLPGQFDVHIEPGSIIRDAYLFVSMYRFNNYLYPEPRNILFNGNVIQLSPALALDNEYIMYFPSSSNTRIIKTIVLNVKDFIIASVQNYTISSPEQPPSVDYGTYCEFYLYITYENPAMQEVCANVFVNDIQPNANMLYMFSSLNPIDLAQNVGLAVNASSMCDTIQDGSFVKVNNVPIGLIGGDEDNALTSCSGVNGTFYYQNGALTGLGNDVANSTMSGLDAIANIESYLSSNTSFNLEFEYQSTLGSQTNPINQLFLTYTTPCAPVDVSVPSDTILCLGSTLQLNATGGQSYEWLNPSTGGPAVGLSCTTCPNPVFTADSSMLYTVRIWNNDSCSVVRPLKINVRPQPTFGVITKTPSECGANTGTVILNGLPNNGIVTNWQEVGGAIQTNNVFQNLSAGNHTFFFTDTNGCQSADTTVFVGEVNSTVASFTVSPQSGAAPLSATITNTSQNATNYEWFLNGVSQGSSFTTSTFGVSGNYEIMLVAWLHAPNCADTAYQTVVVFDSLVVTLPNVFTPNFDGTNDFFTLTANQNVNYELIILNRWGNVC